MSVTIITSKPCSPVYRFELAGTEVPMILPVPTNLYSMPLSVLEASDPMQSVWPSPSHWICTCRSSFSAKRSDVSRFLESDFGVFQASCHLVILPLKLEMLFHGFTKVVLWLLEASHFSLTLLDTKLTEQAS